MKKKILFAASAVALAIVTLTACSDKKEGVDAANDESVVGATDGMETDTEVTEEIFAESPGQLDSTGETATTDNVTVEDVVANGKEAGQNLIDKAKAAGETALDKTKEGYEKGKDAVVDTYGKAKDATKNAYEKTKDATKGAYDKAKDGVNNALDKVKNL